MLLPKSSKLLLVTLATTRFEHNDAVQLASAIAVRTALLGTQTNIPNFTLVSADHSLNDAARLEGIQVEDPNVH